jgi:ABC-2 type transport system ATP-binding protein
MLYEVERICDRVAILRAGSVAAEGKVRDLIAGDQRLWLDATPAQAVLDRLGSMGSYQDGGVAAQIQRSEAPALLAALAADGVKIFEARWLRRNLESVFLAETEGP